MSSDREKQNRPVYDIERHFTKNKLGKGWNDINLKDAKQFSTSCTRPLTGMRRQLFADRESLLL